MKTPLSVNMRWFEGVPTWVPAFVDDLPGAVASSLVGRLCFISCCCPYDGGKYCLR